LELAEKQSSNAAAVIQVCAASALTLDLFCQNCSLQASGGLPPRLPVTLRP
jgi:hypothetical protein